MQRDKQIVAARITPANIGYPDFGETKCDAEKQWSR